MKGKNMFTTIKAALSKLSGKDSALPDFTGKFRVGRGSGGFAFHVIEGNDWRGLCGTSVIERKSEITPAELENRIPKQHETFYYCSECVTAFTGISVEEQRSLRKGK